ncbi:MAG: hypothetical protein DWQ37_08760 [Planctomycetota bacterium]|nr:MAG: hypothetical protein DWQ37_08760 [Planctomycetota bacterium]
MIRPLAAICLIAASIAAIPATTSAAELSAGFGLNDVTPDVEGSAVYIAGYGQNRRAEGVHDPLYARAIVLADGDKKVALCSVDVVGLQYPTVQQIRKRLEGFDYVLVASTHNHEGPDTVGIWGPTPFKSGVDPKYMESLVAGCVEAIEQADAARVPVSASYGTAADEKLLRDSREPYVKDDVLRIVRFDKAGTTEPACLLVNWTCHPEALASRNKQITADFPFYTIRDLEKKYGCPVFYVSGAVGGLMAPPRGIYTKSDGSPLEDGNFEYAERLGSDVAKLAVEAVEAAKPVKLVPIRVSAKPITVPLENTLYRAAQAMGVLDREGRLWTGNPEELGRKYKLPDDAKHTPAGVTEVGYVGLGAVHIAGIPGEIYPELVYGRVQDPVDPGADFPDAAVEPSVVEILPGGNFLLFGLANDELGYIVPKRQWDAKPPFAYGRDDSQYGEENSCGPSIAPILMEALKRRVAEAK